LIQDWKTKDFGLNDNKHSLNLICSWFHHEYHSDLLVLSPSIWICYIFRWFNSYPVILIFWFCPDFWWWDIPNSPLLL